MCNENNPFVLSKELLEKRGKNVEFDEFGLRINVDYELFKKSGEKCYFCWLGWSKYDGRHLHPHNVGWVKCELADSGEVESQSR